MLNLSINEQKEILGGTRYKAIIYDADGSRIDSENFSSYEDAYNWAEYQAAHLGRTYSIRKYNN
ncbi:hypothetical protein NNC19_21525 [Clostridium sp. SHJSY1]|uniref:hypothetical protein n=1 Tax=Clostridium sp. SHJSY1 TaxID=2942483 RepID=UPI002875B4B3|nr:hypothetical protein [Clostridium sp. SHJSY1]MDS0528270.1 hypothetical protein [Clostridium sp. SHJSY1]